MDDPPSGLILVDKPQDVTSHDVVDQVRHALGIRRVGHAGTLDPMATGLLIVGFGRATRLLRYFGELAKTYEGTGRLGVETDTLDAQGTVVRRSTPSEVTREQLDAVIASMIGRSMQRPPAYSAVKVAGRKLYEAARRGETLTAPPRPIRVDAFHVDRFDGRDFDFLLTCSGGTYVRVLVAEVGTTLGHGAHLARLRRTAIGPYRVEEARATDGGEIGRRIGIDDALRHLPSVALSQEEARAASHGRPLGPTGLDGPYGVFDPDGHLVGIYRDDGTIARPEVILAGS